MIHQPKKTEALWLWIDGRKIHLALYNQDCHMPFVGYTFIFFFFLGGKSNQSIHNLISEILKYRSNIVSSLRHVCDYSLLHFMGTVTRRRKESIRYRKSLINKLLVLYKFACIWMQLWVANLILAKNVGTTIQHGTSVSQFGFQVFTLCWEPQHWIARWRSCSCCRWLYGCLYLLSRKTPQRYI